MAVHRIHKTKDYTIMGNTVFKDKRLSLKAKGLHALMMSLPDEWDYSTEGLTYLVPDGKSAITSALKELEVCGYLVRSQGRNNGVFTGYIYDIYEVPQSEQPQDILPSTEKPSTVNPSTEKRTQLNTNKLNTNKSKSRGFIPPTLDEVKSYVADKNLIIDPVQFYEFFTEGDWIDSYGKKVLNWKQKMLTWNKKELERHPEKKQTAKLKIL